MAELKTRPSGQSVTTFLAGITDPKVREECRRLSHLMRSATGFRPKMWGTNIIGFGAYRFHYASGRSGEWFLAGFSPRKRDLTVYLTAGFDRYDHLLKSLGKVRTGRGCLYLRSLDDVHLPTLRKLVRACVRDLSRANA